MRAGVLCALLGAMLVLTGCTTDAPDVAVSLPPAGAVPDYQLGGAYEPSPAVGIVVRDRAATPASGRYSICYVNAFQTQPGELDSWADELVLTDASGSPVIDPAWPDEALLDTSSAENRAAIAGVVEAWIAACADAGFDAVEFDNLDSASRSDGALTDAGNLALAQTLVSAAHGQGLAAAQKNAAELSREAHDEAGFDFAIAEECAAFDECAAYTSVYGDVVIDIEYDVDRFTAACADADTPASVVLRDRDLVTPDTPTSSSRPADPATRVVSRG